MHHCVAPCLSEISRHLGPQFFFFNDTATTEIYTLSLHDALPISLAAISASAALWLRGESGRTSRAMPAWTRSEEHTSELQSHSDLVCRLLLEKKKTGVLDQTPQLR